jgi:hypothetical protein
VLMPPNRHHNFPSCRVFSARRALRERDTPGDRPCVTRNRPRGQSVRNGQRKYFSILRFATTLEMIRSSS